MTGSTMHSISEEWKNTGEKSVGFDLTEDILFFAAGYPAMVTLLDALHTPGGGYVPPFFLLGGLLLSTLCRRRCRIFGVYLLLELLAAGGITALSLWAGGIAAAVLAGIGMAVAVGVGIHRFWANLSPEELRYDPEAAANYHPYMGQSVPIAGTAVLCVSHLASLFLHRDRGWLCLGCLTVLLAGYAVYSRRRGENALLADGSPGNRAFRRLNRQLNWLLALLIPAGGALFYGIYRAAGLTRLDQAAADWFHRQPHIDATSSAPSAPGAVSSPAMHLPRDLPADSSPLLAAMGSVVKLLAAILGAAAILAALAATGVAVARLLRYRRTASPAVRRSPIPTAPAKTARIRRGFPAFGRIAGAGNRVRIRRLYARMVRRAIRAGIKIAPSDTPAEIAEKLGAQPPVREATALYEKARYDAGDCTRDEVERMKRWVSGR